MYDFALSLGAFLLIALGLGIAFAKALAGPQSLPSASVALDIGALALTAALAASIYAQRPDFWFPVVTILFLVFALLWSWITRSRRNESEPVALTAQRRSSMWISFGARLIAFLALAVFALLTRPPCPPCSGT